MRPILINKVFGFYAGRDWMTGPRSWSVWIDLIPRIDLTEEGRMILCGFGFQLLFGKSLYGKPYIRVWVRSDAGEIAIRNAAPSPYGV